jgi:hypothetical protein
LKAKWIECWYYPHKKWLPRPYPSGRRGWLHARFWTNPKQLELKAIRVDEIVRAYFDQDKGPWKNNASCTHDVFVAQPPC